MNPPLNKDLRQKLEKFSNLPSIPQIIVKIKQVAENPKASAAELANCILSDHQLTSRILRMANSTYYGNYSGKITTVTHAIVMMGFKVVHNIAVSMAVYELVNKISGKSKFDMTSFWTRSLSCGVIAKYLATFGNKPKLLEVAFIAGFMHDIGQAVLAGAYPDKYDQILKLEDESNDILKAEDIILGINHQEVGEYVGAKWNLPQSLIRPIAEHHRSGKTENEQSKNVLVDLVYLGDLIYPYVMSSVDPESEEYKAIIEQTQLLVDISDEKMVELLPECKEQISEIARDLEINIENEFISNTDSQDMQEIHQKINSQEVQLAFLRNAAGSLMEAKEHEEILLIICEAIFRGLQMGRVVIFRYIESENAFVGDAGYGFESQEAIRALKFSAGSGIFKSIKDNKKPMSIVDINEDGIVNAEEIKGFDAKAFGIVPIMILDEAKYVIFADKTNRDEPISNDYLGSIESLANQAGLVLERNLLREKMNG